MHFCSTNCFTLWFHNGIYGRADGSDETWTIERFTSTSFLLHRHDAPAAWNGFSADVAYQGQVSNDQLINVTVNGKPVPDINVAWGTALNTLPGSNAERDERKSAQSQAQPPPLSSAPPTEDIEPGVDANVSAAEAPPPLLNYEQAPVPEQGDLWTPGYWGWGGEGYYWVPGAWVAPPRVGLLWTPGYWAFAGALYVFHPGYWAPHIGFYGGINYGYGYVGSGFFGGRWVGNSFAYNRTVSNVNASVIHNTYNEAVVNTAAANKVSYNSGPGGTTATPTAQERAFAAEPHIRATPRQRQIIEQSARNPALLAQAHRSHPAAVGTKTPAVVNAPAVVKAYGTAAPAARGQSSPAHAAPKTAAHAQSGAEQPAAPTTTAHPQGGTGQPAAKKPAGATAAKAPHPKQ